MIVDRPGLSDREVVSPTVGIVTELFHVPGDTVRLGDKLFTIRLASESLHQTQSELFKTGQDLRLADAQHSRLATAGDSIPRARLIEVENEIERLKAAGKAFRQELANRAFTPEQIEGVAAGNFVSEISIVTPGPIAEQQNASAQAIATFGDADPTPQTFAYELQTLPVQLGEQVEAGRTLCLLSTLRLLAIEGRAFRDETALLERSIEQDWPVEVDFQESGAGDWPANEQTFPIRFIANTIDPQTRTFAFLMPLENQYKEVRHGDKTQLLWRYRPGQKVILRIRVEKLENVFVLPADAVVIEGAEAYLFTQNVNTFQRKSVHVVHRNSDQVAIANDGTLPTYPRGADRWTIHAVVRAAATQLNRMTKAGGSSSVPKGFHIHADGSLHKNEDEAKQ
jgi:cobalt-zinc-cadmium efflux system membrane fusion protein